MTRINITTTSGFKKEEGIKVIVYEPSADPTIESGNRMETSFIFILPDNKKVNELVIEENVLASLLVPNATVGGNPTNRSAGREINPPPPTTESTNAATNPATIKKMSISRLSCSIRICPSNLSYHSLKNSS